MQTRSLTANIEEALQDTPVVLLAGARQTGKSTLMQALTGRRFNDAAKVAQTNQSQAALQTALRRGSIAALKDIPKAAYYTLDDPQVMAAARADPHGFVAAQVAYERVLIDEVQRVPELFLAIKHAVDQRRIPGRFLLTGSANVMLLPRVSESLAGRIEIQTLRPLSQLELSGDAPEKLQSGADVIAQWFGSKADFVNWKARVQSLPQSSFVEREALAQCILRGGYPEVLQRSARRAGAWFDNYLQTVLLRDIRDIANIDATSQLPQLLRAVALKTTGMFNLADVSRSLGLPQTTLRRYMTLLETVYLIEPLPAWTHRLSQRAQKTPKYYLGDTGLLAHVLGITRLWGGTSHAENASAGAMVESFALQELRKAVDCSALRGIELLCYRTSTGTEVDFIVQDRAGRVIGVEVKSALSASAPDFKGLKHLRELLGDQFLAGFVFHTGQQTLAWDPQLMSMPISALWASNEPE